MTKDEEIEYYREHTEDNIKCKREIVRLRGELAQAKEDVVFWKTLFDRAQKTSESLLETNRALTAHRYSK